MEFFNRFDKIIALNIPQGINEIWQTISGMYSQPVSPFSVIPVKEDVARVEFPPAVIFAKAGIHLAVDALFCRKNDGEWK